MEVHEQSLKFNTLLAVALDTLIADIPVDANLEKALSPIIDPVVQYIVSTPALATPLAGLLGVNSQLVSCWTPASAHPALVTKFMSTDTTLARPCLTSSGPTRIHAVTQRFV